MGNHVHLLLRTGRLPISTLMRRLLTGYAQQFNRRHRRHGVLFQNRYKSILCGDERILGNGDFVQSVLKQAQEQYEKKTLARVKGLKLESIIERVAKKLGLDPADTRSAGRQRMLARARALIGALAIEYLGISGRELARRLNMSPSAVSKLVQRGRKDPLTEKLAGALFQERG